MSSSNTALVLAGGGSYRAVQVGMLRTLVETGLRFDLIEEARLPLHIVATDMLSGAEVVLSHGAVEPALLASTAIPLAFPGVPIDARLLVDGGVACNTPIDSAVPAAH